MPALTGDQQRKGSKRCAQQGRGAEADPRKGHGWHREEEAVELFAANLVKAGNAFLDNPMETPFIPSWNRVCSAEPELLTALYDAVAADLDEFGA